MRNNIAFLYLLIMALPAAGLAQQTITASITHDTMQREYILYVPADYTGDTAVPLVINLHGYTSDATSQMWYGDFRPVADTAGFLVVHPEGTIYQGSTHWNVGGWTVGSTVDDVGFISDLIDSLSAAYNIDSARIYSTGMSNGGFMSYLLACQLSNKIAAIASVTGSMTPESINDCNPQHPVPVLQIHGTSDGTVPYTGTTWSEPVMDVVEYWADFNNCNMTPAVTPIPDTDTIDGSTVEYYVYSEGDNGSVSEHFKITGGDHTWPGNAIGGAGTNYDMDASLEIWKFLSRYDINGERTPAEEETSIKPENKNELKIYPNPADSEIRIDGAFKKKVRYEIFSVSGKSMEKGITKSDSKIDLSGLNPGVYILKVHNNSYKVLKTE